MNENDSSLPSLPSWGALAAIAGLFLAIALAMYGWGLKNPFVRWDDGLLVYENPAVRQISAANLKYVFTHFDPELYIPVTFLTYQFDYLIGAGSTLPFHLGNLLLHTVNALFAGWLAFLLSKKNWMGFGLGLLFLVHPLHAEAVMWVSARKDVLSAFFFLSTLLLWLYARERGSRRLYWLSVGSFVLGLLAKVMIIPLPLVLVLLELRDRRRVDRSMIIDKLPYLAVALVLGIVAVLGKTGVIQSSSLASKVLMAFLSSVFYLTQILLPLKFSLLYPYVKPITLASPDFLVPIAVWIAVGVGAVMLWRKTREPLLWLLFFLFMVAPSFVNFSKGDMDTYFASDRYAYLASFGVLYLVLLGVAWLGDRRSVREATLLGGVGVIAVILAVKAHAQSKTWENTETLFQNVIAQYPDASHVAYNNIGNVQRLRGDVQIAVDSYQKALAIRPHPKVLSNLGAAYRKLGQRDLSLQSFRKALEMSPTSKDAHFGMGLLLADDGKYLEAVREYENAVATDPQYEEAYTNMGAAYLAAGKPEEAIVAYRKALAINPFFPDALYNLAVVLAEQGKIDEAIGAYEKVTRLAPRFLPAKINLGLLYAQTGKIDDARAQFNAVLDLSPQNPAARQMIERLSEL